MTRFLAFLAAAFIGSGAWAATARGQFTVQVTVIPPGERCFSETVSQPAAAVVQVVCSSGNYVSIVPAPGSFVGTHSSAYRYAIHDARAGGISASTGEFLTASAQEVADGVRTLGTVTGFRLVGDSSAADNLFELLISF